MEIDVGMVRLLSVILPMVLQICETMVLQRIEREGKGARRIFEFLAHQ